MKKNKKTNINKLTTSIVLMYQIERYDINYVFPYKFLTYGNSIIKTV